MADPQTNSDEFIKKTVAPVLADMGMDSSSAEKLLIMTATHESMGYRYRAQVGGGPALSYYQIEPNTLNDLYENYLAFRPGKQALLDAYLPDGMSRTDALKNIDTYATAAARLIYARVPDALPGVGDDEALAAYAKEFWNTELGAATVQQFLDDYKLYGPKQEPANWA